MSTVQPLQFSSFSRTIVDVGTAHHPGTKSCPENDKAFFGRKITDSEVTALDGSRYPQYDAILPAELALRNVELTPEAVKAYKLYVYA